MNTKQLIAIIFLILPISIICYFWWISSGVLLFLNGSEAITALGRLAGLLLAFSVLLQVFLRSRSPLIERLLGFESLNRIHKKNGYAVFTFLILHPVLLLIGYSLQSNVPLYVQLYLFLFTYQGVLKAFLAALILLGVMGTSIFMVRKNLAYELWYFIHLSVYIAILFAWGHQLAIGTDFLSSSTFTYFWYMLYIFVLGNLFIFRILKQVLDFHKYRFSVSSITKETKDTYSLIITGWNIEQFNFESGQFAFLRFLSKDNWWESHPFSFSKGKGEILRFTIKISGDFTKRLKELPVGTPVIIDGPHGDFTLGSSISKKNVFIAGGVGITPIRALLESSSKDNAVLIYASKTQSDIIFRKEIDTLSKNNHFSIYYVLSQDKRFKGLKGRITKELLTKTVKNLRKKDIYICGPQGMVQELTHELGQIIPQRRIHTELFSL